MPAKDTPEPVETDSVPVADDDWEAQWAAAAAPDPAGADAAPEPSAAAGEPEPATDAVPSDDEGSAWWKAAQAMLGDPDDEGAGEPEPEPPAPSGAGVKDVPDTTDDDPGDDGFWDATDDDDAEPEPAPVPAREPEPGTHAVEGSGIRVPDDFDWTGSGDDGYGELDDGPGPASDEPAAEPMKADDGDDWDEADRIDEADPFDEALGLDGVADPPDPRGSLRIPVRPLLIGLGTLLAVALAVGGGLAAWHRIGAARAADAHDAACATLAEGIRSWDAVAGEAGALGVEPGKRPDPSCGADTDALKARADATDTAIRKLGKANGKALDEQWARTVARIQDAAKNSPKAKTDTLGQLETLAKTRPSDAKALAKAGKDADALIAQAAKEHADALAEEKRKTDEQAAQEAQRKAQEEAQTQQQQQQATPQYTAPTPRYTAPRYTAPAPRRQAAPTPPRAATPAPQGNADSDM